jgi:anti-sigma28 factor (negative regulator of flagellin synthesis)
LKNLSGNADSSIVETGEVAMKIDGVSPVEAQLPVDTVAVRVSSPGQATTQSAAQDWTSFHSDALRESVNSGQYQVDPNKIAAAISESGGA